MSAQRDAILDAIVMVVVADGVVTEREMQLAMGAARDLPSLQPVSVQLEAALGAAFERFVDEGSEARIAAIAAAGRQPSPEARLEILLAAAVAAMVDGPATEGELAFMARLARAVGASDEELTRVVAAAGHA